jgi:hypothetical protein
LDKAYSKWVLFGGVGGGDRMLGEPNTLFLILGAAIALAAGGGIVCLFSNTDLGFTLFKFLYALSMLVSVVTLSLFAVELIIGNLNLRSNLLIAVGACAVALLSIFYGFFGFVHSRSRPLQKPTSSIDYDMRL